VEAALAFLYLSIVALTLQSKNNWSKCKSLWISATNLWTTLKIEKSANTMFTVINTWLRLYIFPNLLTHIPFTTANLSIKIIWTTELNPRIRVLQIWLSFQLENDNLLEKQEFVNWIYHGIWYFIHICDSKSKQDSFVLYIKVVFCQYKSQRNWRRDIQVTMQFFHQKFHLYILHKTHNLYKWLFYIKGCFILWINI